jgi:hypothetical protein
MDFNPDEKTEQEMRDFFRVNKDKHAVDDMSEQMFVHLHQRLKLRQLTWFAFLNKEFNTLNFKSAKCSMHCFDDASVPLNEVNKCLQVCRTGIKDCHEFAHVLQKEADKELKQCTTEAEDQKNLTDPVTHWISCYEKLILRFDAMETNIHEEFSNFV